MSSGEDWGGEHRQKQSTGEASCQTHPHTFSPYTISDKLLMLCSAHIQTDDDGNGCRRCLPGTPRREWSRRLGSQPSFPTRYPQSHAPLTSRLVIQAMAAGAACQAYHSKSGHRNTADFPVSPSSPQVPFATSHPNHIQVGDVGNGCRRCLPGQPYQEWSRQTSLSTLPAPHGCLPGQPY